MAIGVAFGLMGAFFMAGMYVAGALGCLSLVMLFFFIPLIAIAYPVLGGSIFAHTHVGVLNELLDQYDAKRSADDAAQSES